MKNPKIRIESDGFATEVYVNEKMIENATMVSFEFQAVAFGVYCEIEKHMTEENGEKILNEEKTETLKETKILIDTRLMGVKPICTRQQKNNFGEI